MQPEIIKNYIYICYMCIRFGCRESRIIRSCHDSKTTLYQPQTANLTLPWTKKHSALHPNDPDDLTPVHPNILH